VKQYGNLYNEARLDAMDALDELSDMADADTLKVKLLLSIVVVSCFLLTNDMYSH